MGYFRADAFVRPQEIRAIQRKTHRLNERMVDATTVIKRLEKWVKCLYLSKSLQNPDLYDAVKYVVE